MATRKKYQQQSPEYFLPSGVRAGGVSTGEVGSLPLSTEPVETGSGKFLLCKRLSQELCVLVSHINRPGLLSAGGDRQ